MASIQTELCIICDCQEPAIRLNCDGHWICRKCLNSPETKLKKDMLSCEKCDQPVSTKQEPSIFVYMDNSNAWIEAKKLYGKEDTSIRIDVGGLLNNVVSKGRNVAAANLYGSEPPPVDTVWKKMEERGWNVNVKARSAVTKKEKQVDTQLVVDVTKMVCSTSTVAPPTNTVVFISGDLDILPAIKVAKEKNWNVEVYMWKHAIASKLKCEAGISVYYLDDNKDAILFNSMKFPIAKDPELLEKVRTNGIVCKMQPHAFGKTHTPSEKWCNEVKTQLGADFRYFWMEELDNKTQKCVNNMLVMVFESIQASSFKLADIIASNHKISRTQDLQTYFEYEQKQRIKQTQQKGGGIIHYFHLEMQEPKLVTKFPEELDLRLHINADEVDDEDDFYSFCTESELRADIQESEAQNITTLDLSSTNSESEGDQEGIEWKVVKRQKKRKKKMQLYSKQCEKGIYCYNGLKCKYAHTDKEKSFFKNNNGRGKLPLKTKQCIKRNCQYAMNCKYAHGEEDAFCYICDRKGHFSQSCGSKKDKQYIA